MTEQGHLGWEASRRTRAALAAFAGALGTLGSTIGIGVVQADSPRASIIDALARSIGQPGDHGAAASLHTPFYRYYDDHTAPLIAYAVLGAVGLLGLAYAVHYLARAARARRPELPAYAVALPLIGGGLAAISTVLQQVGIALAISDFLSGPRTVASGDTVTQSSLLITAQLIALPASLALAIGVVMGSLNAMRVGLVTRFVGVIGVMVGIMSVVLLGSPLLVLLEAFWLVSLGLVYLGRAPGGAPPAWASGRAEPWPDRRSAAASKPASAAAPAPSPPSPTEDAAGPQAQRRRKRKRR